MNLSNSDIVNIFIAVFTFIGGLIIGWFTNEISRRAREKEQKEQKREEYLNLLTDLDKSLTLNEKHYNKTSQLLKEIKSKFRIKEGLFEAPDYVQKVFNQSGKPDRWKARIELLIRNNEDALKSAETLSSHFKIQENEQLMNEIDKFINHAQEFNAIWLSIFGKKEIAPGINFNLWYFGKNPVEEQPQQEIEKYPKDLDRLLDEEIERVKILNYKKS